MLPELLGRKIGMTQLFMDDGHVVPVTVLEAGPCYITQIKTTKTDGYNAVQMGFDDTKKKKNISKALFTHFDKAKVKPCRYLKEIRLTADEAGEKVIAELKLGGQVKVDIFENTWKVNVLGVTKGRGFTGMVKRWNKHRGPETHGSRNVREIGATGSDTRLTHIRPGKHMPGHYGTDNRTVQYLEVVKVDKERNLLFIKGAVPGFNGGYVIIKKTDLVKPAPRLDSKKKKGKSMVHSRGQKR